MKKLVYLAIVALAASMVACGGKKEAPATEPVEEATEVIEEVVEVVDSAADSLQAVVDSVNPA